MRYSHFPMSRAASAVHSSATTANNSVDVDATDNAAPAPLDDASVLDHLARRFGRMPWWLISLICHAIVFTLVVLSLTVVPHEVSLLRIEGVPLEPGPIDPDIHGHMGVYTPTPEQLLVTNTTLPELSPIETVSVEDVLPEPTIDCDPTETITAPECLQSTDNDTTAYTQLDISWQSGGVGCGGAHWGTDTLIRHQRSMIRCFGCGGWLPLDGGVDWLAKHQEPDGHWDTVKYGAQEASRCDTAATSMAILAMLAIGNSDKRGRYKDNIKRGLDWLIEQQQTSGLIQPGANGRELGNGPGYAHAIAGLALAEAYGMSRSAWLKAPAQKAVTYSVTVHQAGTDVEKSGWRYNAHEAGDTSVSTWFIMQLKTARLAGLDVPQQGFAGAVAFLESVEVKPTPDGPCAGSRFKYQAQTAEAKPLPTLMGCTARMVLGWPRNDLQPGIDWATQKIGLPAWGDNGAAIDWYYLYYGTFTAYQLGGDSWKQWDTALKAALDPHQRHDGDEAGSWDPTGTYANLGRVWSTANATLCLEVCFRYGQLYARRPGQ